MDRKGEDVDVQALQREVELLKTLLHQERKKSSTIIGIAASQRDLSPTRPVSPAKSQESHGGRDSERSPRKNVALSNASQRGKSMRWSSVQSPADANDRAMHLQHVPVDTKRGRWWLKDRQILSTNVPSPLDDCIAMKVRETWLWSGRAVVIDKIVTCPSAVDDESDEFNEPGDENEEHEEHYEQASVHGSPENKPKEPYQDSKQLAQEFMQFKTPAAGDTGATIEPLQAASSRMEHQMSIAAAQMTAEKTQQPVAGGQSSPPGKTSSSTVQS